MKINISPRFPAKRFKKYAVNIIFFTAFHSISYKISPPNIDPGCDYKFFLTNIRVILGDGLGLGLGNDLLLQMSPNKEGEK